MADLRGDIVRNGRLERGYRVRNGKLGGGYREMKKGRVDKAVRSFLRQWSRRSSAAWWPESWVGEKILLVKLH
jgi:hypothetical protein